MNGGRIFGNTSRSAYSEGGGVYVYKDGTFAIKGMDIFTMSGGEIYDNTVNVGGREYIGDICTSEITLSGTAKIGVIVLV